MKQFGNLPLNIPTVLAYRDSPFAAYLHFPTGYLMPVVTARAVSESGALLALDLQPDVEALNTLVAISFTDEQMDDLPDYVRLLIAFDGVDKLGTRLELSNGVAAFPQNVVLNYEGSDIRLSLYDLDSVNMAREYRNEAAASAAAAALSEDAAANSASSAETSATAAEASETAANASATAASASAAAAEASETAAETSATAASASATAAEASETAAATSAQETQELRDEAMSAIGNIMVLIDSDEVEGWVDVALGSNFTIAPGPSSDPFPYVDISFPVYINP